MPEPVIESAGECYREIKKRGLHLRKENGRDDALLKELTASTGCKDDKLQEFLDGISLSAEDFLRAFLRITQPFSRMYQEIWNYLSEKVAPSANEMISIRFGFTGTDQDEIDLEVFRRQVEILKKVELLFTVPLWPLEAMDKLFNLRDIVKNPAKNNERSSLPGYRAGDLYNLPPLYPTACPFDQKVLEIHTLFQNIINESHERNRAEKTGDPESKNHEPILGIIPEDWRSYAYPLTDLIPGWNQVFTSLENIPADKKDKALAFFEGSIAPLLPIRKEEAMIPVKEALDILDLPCWKHRWHTYEIWTSVLALNCLQDYKPVPRIKEGRIPFDDFATAILADLSTHAVYGTNLAIQVQTPYTGPSRKHIKPDLRICETEDVQDPANTLFVIECKQREKTDKRHIEEVASSYLNGSPRAAGVIIANYDRPALSLSMPERTYYIDDFHPANRAAVKQFKNTLLAGLSQVGLVPPREGVIVLLLDVSESMNSLYKHPDYYPLLREAFKFSHLKIFGFNDDIVAKKNLLVNDKFYTGGGTNLGHALDQLTRLLGEIDGLLIFTDGGHEGPDFKKWKIKKVLETDGPKLHDYLMSLSGMFFYPKKDIG